MRSLPERLNSKLVGVWRMSFQRLRLRAVAIVPSAATRLRSSGDGMTSRLPEAMLKLLDRDPTGGAVKAELIGDSVALIVGCPNLSAFELSRSGHVPISIT